MTADPDADPDFEPRVLGFERAWRRGEVPAIRDHLAGCGGGRATLLAELVCLDLECRWRAGTRPLRCEDYAREFPELGPPAGWPADLVAEEYRARHRWGDRPTHEEFVARFGGRPDLAPLLRRVDEELHGEALDRATDASAEFRDAVAYGDLRLRRMIGAGGFGKVYVADRRGVAGPVAVKFLRKSFWRRPAAVRRFLAEAETVARLRHDGVVAVRGGGRTPAGGPYLVMDLVDGPDLSRVLRVGPVAAADAVRWVTQACAAVAHAHANNVVHCDLKPSNLLLGPRGRVVVTDFGLARGGGLDAACDGGTPGYMAPEQVDPRRGPIGPAADVYGLGAVLAALLGVPPGSGRGPLAGAVPAGLGDICRRCLADRPEDRYRDAAELAAALAGVENG